MHTGKQKQMNASYQASLVNRHIRRFTGKITLMMIYEFRKMICTFGDNNFAWCISQHDMQITQSQRQNMLTFPESMWRHVCISTVCIHVCSCIWVVCSYKGHPPQPTVSHSQRAVAAEALNYCRVMHHMQRHWTEHLGRMWISVNYTAV